MEAPIDAVRRCCAAWSDGMTVDDLAALLTDDTVYHNIPMAPITGREAIANNFATIIRPGPLGIESIDFRVINNIAADGPGVMT